MSTLAPARHLPGCILWDLSVYACAEGCPLAHESTHEERKAIAAKVLPTMSRKRRKGAAREAYKAMRKTPEFRNASKQQLKELERLCRKVAGLDP